MATQGSPGSVVLSAAGALKNLSLVSAEASEEMVKQDVMTPLCALLKNTFGSADWSPLTKPSAKRDGGVDEKSEIFTEAVGLLWNLCEVSESAVAVFNKENLVDLLMRHVGNEKFELTVKLPVMQCMYTASEDNDEIHEKIRANSDLFQAILSATPGKNDVHADHLYLQMLTVGLVLNSANSSQSEDLPESTWRLIFAIIGKILNLDQRKMASCPIVHIHINALTIGTTFRLANTLAPALSNVMGRRSRMRRAWKVKATRATQGETNCRLCATS